MSSASPRTLESLLQAAGLEMPLGLAAAMHTQISAVVCDSRKATPGSLFVALPGHATAGYLYMQDAIDKGCHAVVVEKGLCMPDCSVPCIPVANAQQALAALAAAWYGHPARQLHCIGITGTNGKTTTSWLIEGMLVHAGFRPGVIGTVNYRYHDPEGPDGTQVIQAAALTTPDALTLQKLLRHMVDAGVTHVVMELSSHALVQGRVDGLRFAVAVFTNLTRDHLDYHRDMEHYFAAKALLFSQHLAPHGVAVLAVGVPGEEDCWGERLVGQVHGAQVLRTGTDEACTIRATALRYGLDGFRCELDACGQKTRLHSPLVGAYNARNVLSAVGAGLGLGLPLEQVCAGLATVEAVPGRLQRVLPPGADAQMFPSVFVDYAHTPDALDNVLRTLRPLRRAGGRLVCVFGCGGDRDRGKRPLMGAIAAKHSELVVASSDNPRTEEPEAILDDIMVGLQGEGAQACSADQLFLSADSAAHPARYSRLADRRKAIAMACSLSRPEDTVLIAGKGHEDYQILGRDKHYFDDRIEALNALASWNERLLLTASGGVKVGHGGQRIVLQKICTDSRALAQGDIFLALRGERFDGHDFIEQAVAAGAGAIIAEQFPAPVLAMNDLLCIKVPDSLQTLGCLAGFRRRLFAGPLRVAAITGSSGKTTVKEMVATICTIALTDQWAQQQPVLKTSGNFNNLVGLPLSLLPLQAGHRVAVLEMGMNAPGEIAQLTRIADPDVGCINNVHPAHLQGLGSVDGVARAKGELFAGMRPEAIRVVNADDPRIYRQLKNTQVAKIGFAVTQAGRRRNPLVRITRLRNLGEQGIRFTLHIGDWAQRLSVPAFGEHNAANCAAAAAVAHAMGIRAEHIAAGLSQYQSMNQRMMAKSLPGGVKLMNDAYNANPASMAAGLRSVTAMVHSGRARQTRKTQVAQGKCVAALGDMLELGVAAPAQHRAIGQLAAELGFFYLALTGHYAQETAQAAKKHGMNPEHVLVFADPQTMGRWCAALLVQGTLSHGDWILVKGSRGMRMEGFIEALEQELHQAPAQGANHAL